MCVCAESIMGHINAALHESVQPAGLLQAVGAREIDVVAVASRRVVMLMNTIQ